MNQPSSSSFGTWLRQQRKALDLTQVELAQQVGCSAETIRKIEADSARPSKQMITAILTALAVPPAEHAALAQLARARQAPAPAPAAESPQGETPDAPWTGKRLGKYKLETLLGRGGMAEVYRAQHPGLDRPVAVKVILPHLAATEGFVERFQREARVVAALRHPNIVQVLDFDVYRGVYYMVMEYVAGETLDHRLRQVHSRNARLPLESVRTILAALCEAVTYAHAQGMMHRDLKPANVILNTHDVPVLTDFGIARMISSAQAALTEGLSGTPSYMSPEQGLGLALDERTDVYALGVMLYEMLAGRLPFVATELIALIMQHVNETPPPLAQFTPDLPPGVQPVVARALAKAPQERFQRPVDLAHAFAEALSATAATKPANRAGVGASQGQMPSGGSDQLSSTVEPSGMLVVNTAKALDPTVVTLAPTLPASTVPAHTPAAPPLAPEIKPPQPTSPPELAEFVGRTAERAALAAQVAARQLVVISGMPGVGKTALAAALARQIAEPARIFWHTFHEGETVTVLIWKLAAFMAHRGRPDLWQMLQGAQQVGAQPPPTEVLFDYLFEMIRGQGYLLCLDDFQFVDDDPLLARFLTQLQKSVKDGEVATLIVSQRKPAVLANNDDAPLGGLQEDDVQALLTRQGAPQPAALVHELCVHTGGNAQFITLAVDAVRRGKQPAQLLARLAESENIERFLTQEVDRRLSQAERAVMQAVAVLLGHAGTRHAIEAILDGPSVQRVLSDLSSRNLLTVGEGEAGRLYNQNGLIQAFYSAQLSRRERQAMHQRAGDYYATEEPDSLKAARHYHQAGQAERAAQIINGAAWTIINQGEAQALRHLLNTFSQNAQSPELHLTHGRVCSLLGDTDAARAVFVRVLTELESAPTTAATQLMRVRACRGLSELLQEELPHEALHWIERGLAELAGADAAEEASLLIRQGRVQMYLGAHTDAEAALTRGLERLPADASRLRAVALNTLGSLYCTRGDGARGRASYQRSWEILHRLQDHWALIDVGQNLGIELEIAGEWSAACNQYTQALAEAQRLASVKQQARISLSLGILCTKQGYYPTAQQHLEDCLALARARGLQSYLAYGQPSLADLYLCQGKPDAAAPLLSDTERIAHETGIREPLPEVERHWARIALQRGQPDSALQHAQAAITLAREFNSEIEIGVALRLLAEAQSACQQPAAAAESFAHSLALLAERDPYEAARTRAAWGRHLAPAAESAALLASAHATFTELGALGDLAAEH